MWTVQNDHDERGYTQGIPTTHELGRTWITSCSHVGAISCDSRGDTALTRPRFMVISNTKWEVNMTRKYRVASSATTPKILGAPNVGILDRIAREIISENARKSGTYSFSRVSVIPAKFNDSWAPYKSAMLMHATNRLLCSTKAQIRYASRGTSGV